MENFIVTTARKPKTDSENLALQFAEKLNLKFIPRADFSFDALKKFYNQLFIQNIFYIKLHSS